FRALGATDEPVVVRTTERRRTAARWELDDSNEVRAVLRWMHGVRAGYSPLPIVLPRELVQRAPSSVSASRDLLVVSNRLPDLRHLEGDEGERKKSVGGLVSALEPALRSRGGMWLGWSGKTVSSSEPVTTGVSDQGEGSSGVQLAWVDYTESWYRDYY